MNNPEKFEIIMVEDDLDFCNAIKELLKLETKYNIDQVYPSCRDFFDDFNNKDWSFVPIFWIDLSLPDGSGIQIISKIKSTYPNSKCLVCTYQSDDKNLFDALKYGADGYILKDTDINTYMQSLQDLTNAGAAMSPSIAKKIIQSFRPDSDLIQMTKRENEVLGLLAKGLLYKEISEQLNISLETTKKHISNIYQKLHVQNRTEAVLKLLNK